jgi:2-dehydro-3-deoxy-D-arabinonate dehydratase
VDRDRQLPFTLAAGDEITVTIAEVGTLTSTVVAGKEPLTWLADPATPR